jgi:hypothetical protein
LSQLRSFIQPANLSQNPNISQLTRVEEGEGETSPAQDLIKGGKAKELPLQGFRDVPPQGPAEPDDGSSTKGLRNVYLHLDVEISLSDQDSSPEQDIQLKARFGFQVRPVVTYPMPFVHLPENLFLLPVGSGGRVRL